MLSITSRTVVAAVRYGSAVARTKAAVSASRAVVITEVFGRSVGRGQRRFVQTEPGPTPKEPSDRQTRFKDAFKRVKDMFGGGAIGGVGGVCGVSYFFHMYANAPDDRWPVWLKNLALAYISTMAIWEENDSSVIYEGAKTVAEFEQAVDKLNKQIQKVLTSDYTKHLQTTKAYFAKDTARYKSIVAQNEAQRLEIEKLKTDLSHAISLKVERLTIKNEELNETNKALKKELNETKETVISLIQAQSTERENLVREVRSRTAAEAFMPILRVFHLCGSDDKCLTAVGRLVSANGAFKGELPPTIEFSQTLEPLIGANLNPELSIINIGEKYVPAETLVKLIYALHTNSSVEELNLASIEGGSWGYPLYENFSQLTAMLKANKKLKKLDLRGNYIDDSKFKKEGSLNYQDGDFYQAIKKSSDSKRNRFAQYKHFRQSQN